MTKENKKMYLTKEQYKRIRFLMHDIKEHWREIDTKDNYINILNLSICISDISEILFRILDKFPEEVNDEKDDRS